MLCVCEAECVCFCAFVCVSVCLCVTKSKGVSACVRVCEHIQAGATFTQFASRQKSDSLPKDLNSMWSNVVEFFVFLNVLTRDELPLFRHLFWLFPNFSSLSKCSRDGRIYIFSAFMSTSFKNVQPKQRHIAGEENIPDLLSLYHHLKLFLCCCPALPTVQKDSL